MEKKSKQQNKGNRFSRFALWLPAVGRAVTAARRA
jgi:hypothetical protein